VLIDTAFGLIQKAHQNKRLAHAYVIAGSPRGAAGELATRILQMLFCRHETPPCGSCDPCRQVQTRTWVDAFWVQPEKKSRTIGIDQMRDDLLKKITQTSLAGGWKAGVIFAADRMLPPAANVFLKTLEEPSPQSLFLLLTDAPQLLLPTIVSRCQQIDVNEAHTLQEPWRTHLLDILAAARLPGPVSGMAAAAQLSDLLEEVKSAAEDEVKAETKADEDGLDEEKDVMKARISARYREFRADWLREMMHWYRDILVCKTGGAPSILRNTDRTSVIEMIASRISLAQALANVQGIDEINRQLDQHNLPEESVLAYWFDRLTAGAGTPTPTVATTSER